MTKTGHYRVVKRFTDVVFAAMILIASLPIQAIVAFLVLTNLGRPIFFTQKRPGKNNESFTLIKFRSMAHAKDTTTKQSDAQRLDAFGRALRASSLDELPSFWNVLRGDMSLVGPRPLLPQYLDLYTPHQRRRHEVRPGITGLAQVSGRNRLEWDEKFRLDVAYVDSYSFLLDLKILALTVVKVSKREGISKPGEATITEFRGPAQGK